MKICVLSWVDSDFAISDPSTIIMTYPDSMSNDDIFTKTAEFFKSNWRIDDPQFADNIADLQERMSGESHFWFTPIRRLADIFEKYLCVNFRTSFTNRSEQIADFG